MTQGDIHNHKNTQNTIKKKIEVNGEIHEKDKEILIHGRRQLPSFLSYLKEQGVSDSRTNRYLSTLNRIFQHVDWRIEKVSKARLSKFIGQLHTDDFTKLDGEPFAESTKNEYKKGLRKLYTDYVEEFKDNLNVKKGYDSNNLINFTYNDARNYTDPRRLPTPKTVKKMVETASKPRNKAYLMLLWSTGGRHGEILGLKWKDVDFSNSVGRVTFRDTKTGGDHTVPMGEAFPLMKRHKEADSKSSDRDSFVFRSIHEDTQLTAGGAASILSKLQEDAGVSDEIKTNPHAFRKARTSYWARQGENESWICKHMNWVQGNDVVAHYCRVAQEDVEKGVAEHLGIEHKGEESAREESKVLTPCECHNCHALNSFEDDVCSECGTTLSSSSLFEEVQIQDKARMFKDEVIRSETSFNPEDLDKKAEEFVQEELV